MDEELRKNVRLRWIQTLFELSHYEFQRKLWVEASVENYFGDYSELTCVYFNDLNLDNGLDNFKEEGFITEKEADIFLEFHKKFGEYAHRLEKKHLSNSKILRDVEWMYLTDLAQENWKQLKKVLVDKTEINFVNELETRFLNIKQDI